MGDVGIEHRIVFICGWGPSYTYLVHVRIWLLLSAGIENAENKWLIRLSLITAKHAFIKMHTRVTSQLEDVTHHVRNTLSISLEQCVSGFQLELNHRFIDSFIHLFIHSFAVRPSIHPSINSFNNLTILMKIKLHNIIKSTWKKSMDCIVIRNTSLTVSHIVEMTIADITNA